MGLQEVNNDGTTTERSGSIIDQIMVDNGRCPCGIVHCPKLSSIIGISKLRGIDIQRVESNESFDKCIVLLLNHGEETKYSPSIVIDPVMYVGISH